MIATERIHAGKTVGENTTRFILDGGNVIAEVKGTEVVDYIRGINLICTDTEYYIYNAHGDVVSLTSTSGAITKTYAYDAFGNETNPSSNDTNPFRYCGEYYDTETGTYCLRARYYDPTVGRFTAEDTHWNTANMIYGDNPQKINEYSDELRLNTYSYAPQINAIMQSGNLYVYCVGNPVRYCDPSGYVTQKGTPPPDSSGYVPPKGKKPEESWNKERGGWEDKNSNIWKPDRAGHGKDRETGDDEHWDVERGDGKGYVNVGKNGKTWGGKGKEPKIPGAKECEKLPTDEINTGVTIVVVVVIIWEVFKWGTAILTTPTTMGGSLVIAGATP